MSLVVSQCRTARAPRRAWKPEENAPDSRPELVVRQADAADQRAIASLRASWQPGAEAWGYIGNMFVREAWRGRGIGSALLAAIVAAADDRGYERLVLSPSPLAVRFFERAGFVVPDATADGDRLLVRPTRRDR